MSNNESKQSKNTTERIQCMAGIAISIAGLVALIVITILFVTGGMSLLFPMYISFAALVFGIELILANRPYLIMGWTLVIALFPSMILTVKAVMMGSFDMTKLPEMVCLGNMILFVIVFALSVLSLVKRRRA